MNAAPPASTLHPSPCPSPCPSRCPKPGGPFLLLLLAALAAPLAAQDADTRPPPPPADEQAMIRRHLRELYRAEYAAKRREDALALARKLLDSARSPSTQGPTRFVLLDEAREIAARAGDADAALEAAGETVRAFAVDGLALEAGTLATLRRAAREPDEIRRLLSRHLDLVDRTVIAGGIDLAIETSGGAAELARRSGSNELAAGAKALRGYLDDIRAEESRARDALAVPPERERPPAASGLAGRYLCLFAGDWGRGAPLLARCDDERLRALTGAELAAPEDPFVRLRIADGWWDVAREERGALPRQRAMARAARWYRLALEGLADSDRTRALQRLQAARESLRPFIPNLPARRVVEFDGSRAAVVVPSFRYDGSHPLTVEALVEVRELPRDKATVAGNKLNSGFGLSIERGGFWHFVFRAGGAYESVRSDAAAETGRRLHVAGVFDGKNLRIYVDGELQRATTAVQQPHEPSPQPLVVGADPDAAGGPADDFLRGAVDEVRVSSSARYSKSFKPPATLEADAPTVLLLHFDEDEGDRTVDASGRGHHGELRGARRAARHF